MGRKRNIQRRKKQLEEKTILTSDSSFLMKEDYTSLRTNVSFSLPGSGGKCIAVTSSVQGEGKSTTALNLALSYAQAGKKALLMECDLRLPTVSARLRLKKDGRKIYGLSQLLIGECTEQKAIQHMEKEQLDVITAGAVPADPSRLLDSAEIETLLTELKQKYDYIIMDCPPVNIVMDACLLAPCVDGYLLAVKHAWTEYREVSHMIEQLKKVNANILGFVYTNAPMETKKYGGYRYDHYGYGQM